MPAFAARCLKVALAAGGGVDTMRVFRYELCHGLASV